MHNSCVIKNVLHTHSQYGEIVDLFTCRLHILRSFITIDYYEIKESKSGNIKIHIIIATGACLPKHKYHLRQIINSCRIIYII